MAVESLIGGIFGATLLVGMITASILFWVWMIVDCSTRKYSKEIDKVVWILIIVLAHIVGALIYFFVIKLANKQ